MDARMPCLIPPARGVPGSLGDPRLDAYLEFVAARSRPNTVLATWFDLKVFFAVVDKPVEAVRPGDVLGFITAQRAGLAYALITTTRQPFSEFAFAAGSSSVWRVALAQSGRSDESGSRGGAVLLHSAACNIQQLQRTCQTRLVGQRNPESTDALF